VISASMKRVATSFQKSGPQENFRHFFEHGIFQVGVSPPGRDRDERVDGLAATYWQYGPVRLLDVPYLDRAKRPPSCARHRVGAFWVKRIILDVVIRKTDCQPSSGSHGWLQTEPAALELPLLHWPAAAPRWPNTRIPLGYGHNLRPLTLRQPA
jgi:hypothetical protein